MMSVMTYEIHETVIIACMMMCTCAGITTLAAGMGFVWEAEY